MAAQRILVTGDRGYIGSVLVPMLVAAGHSVSGLDQRYYEDCALGSFAPKAKSRRLDIRDVEPDALAGFDAIIHLAALSNDPLGEIDHGLTYEINHGAAVRLATLARAAGVRRFVMSSSCSTYGRAGSSLIDESSPLNPVTAYGRSKVMAEDEIAPLACESFSPVFLRHATVYGHSPMIRFDLVINNLLAYAVVTGEVYLKSDGLSWRPLVHVEDVARACFLAATAPAAAVHGEVFNIGRTEENFRIIDIAELVAAAVPGSRIVRSSGAAPDARSYRVDFSKAALGLPGFKPRWTVPAGIEQLYRVFSAASLTGLEFEHARYSRVAKICSLLQSGTLDASLRWRAAATLPA
jgi:nucleoside-diphosphate-sugar epimerase